MSSLLISMSDCFFFPSISTTGWSIWLPQTMTTLWTSSEVPAGRFAWRQLAWCSSMMCCRTWRGANRQKNYGSGSRWRWPPSHHDCSRDQRGQRRPISCSYLPPPQTTNTAQSDTQFPLIGSVAVPTSCTSPLTWLKILSFRPWSHENVVHRYWSKRITPVSGSLLRRVVDPSVVWAFFFFVVLFLVCSVK